MSALENGIGKYAEIPFTAATPEAVKLFKLVCVQASAVGTVPPISEPDCREPLKA